MSVLVRSGLTHFDLILVQITLSVNPLSSPQFLSSTAKHYFLYMLTECSKTYDRLAKV